MTPSRTRLVTLVVELGTFVLILGIPDGALGVLWPSMRQSFHLPLEALGPVTLAGTVLYFTGGLAGHRVAALLGPAWTMAASCAVALAGLVAWAVAPDFVTVLVGVGVLGLARGVIDAVVNAEAVLEGGVRRLGVLHASWAVGGSLGPVLVGAVIAGAGNWRLAVVVVAAGVLLLVPVSSAAARTSDERSGPSPAEVCPPGDLTAKGSAPDKGRTAVAVAPPLGEGGQGTTGDAADGPEQGVERGRGGVLTLTVIVFGVYSAAEAGPIAWGYTYLIFDRGLTHLVAAVALAGFWAALTVGRLALAAVGERATGTAVLEGSCLLLMAGTAMFWLLPGYAVIAGLPVAGLGSAAIFPMLVALTPVRVGTAGTGRAVGASIAAAALGGPAAVTLLGLAAARFGVGVLGACVFGAAVVLYLANRGLTFSTRRVERWSGSPVARSWR